MALILALDLGLSTGWALGEVGDFRPSSGTWPLPPTNLGLGRTWAAFENELLRMFKLRPDRLVMEAGFQTSAAGGKTNPDTMRLLAGLNAVAHAAAYRWQVEPIERAASTVRKRVLGRGTFAKDEAKREVVAWCHRKGWPVQTDDEADALVLWQYENWMMTPQGTRAVA